MAKKIHLCLARMSEAGLEQKYIQEAIETKCKQSIFAVLRMT